MRSMWSALSVGVMTGLVASIGLLLGGRLVRGAFGRGTARLVGA